jgi:hypothetical protein
MKLTKQEVERLLEGLCATATDAERITCPLIKRIESIHDEMFHDTSTVSMTLRHCHRRP